MTVDLPWPLLCSGTAQTTYCARALPRPLLCSGTDQTILSLGDNSDHGDCSDHGRARGLLRPLPYSGVAMTTAVLGDSSDHFLEFSSPQLHVICTHIQLRDIYLDLATRLILRLPASSGTTSVRCTCRCILFCLYGNWILNFSGISF